MSETRFSATMIHGRLLRLAVLTAAVLSLMAVMSPPPALAASDQRCSQRGPSSANDIKCVFDIGTRYATVDTKISRLLTVSELDILNDAVVNVLNNHPGCRCDVVLPPSSCAKAIEDVVRATLLSFGNITILAPINVVVDPCRMLEACLTQGL